jgi:endonuclease G
MAGYNPDSLSVAVPLPNFAPSVAGHVLHRTELRDGVFADYVNYTVAMHGPFRTPLFAALNVDQTQYQGTTRSSSWKIDSRIGAEFQLDNAYYADTEAEKNPWDRGHLAGRATAGWGGTKKIAQSSADETFYYSNSTIQQENFNRDE